MTAEDIDRLERKLDWIAWKLRQGEKERLRNDAIRSGLLGGPDFLKHVMEEEVRVWPGDLP